MIVRKLRLQQGWSQETLAELTGLSTRTIQRIERGDKPGLESAKSLAAVFEVDLATFTSEELDMPEESNQLSAETIASDEIEALEYIKGIKEFYNHLVIYLVFVAAYGSLCLFADIGDKTVILLGALGWGIGVLINGLTAYEIINIKSFNALWEKSLVEKRLKRKL